MDINANLIEKSKIDGKRPQFKNPNIKESDPYINQESNFKSQRSTFTSEKQQVT